VHMIIVTWIETRACLREYGKPIAALWRAEADQEQYEYACEYVSRSGYRVHTFPTTMSLADAMFISKPHTRHPRHTMAATNKCLGLPELRALGSNDAGAAERLIKVGIS
jgi:hypothetical protein